MMELFCKEEDRTRLTGWLIKRPVMKIAGRFLFLNLLQWKIFPVRISFHKTSAFNIIFFYIFNLFPRWGNLQTHHFEGVAGNRTSSTLVLGTVWKLRINN